MTETKRQPHNPCLFAVDEAGRGFTEIGLRDLFAGFAAAGVLSMNAGPGIAPTPTAVAKDAYLVADALLAQREVSS